MEKKVCLESSIWDNEIEENDVLRLKVDTSTPTPTPHYVSYDYYDDPYAEKPVIYIYPKEEIDANVSINLNGKFTAVYPEFTNQEKSEWSVHASPGGKLKVGDREYTSLFWEGEAKYYIPTFETGFIVTKENAIKFLEDKLRILGLTDLEANEFITYWIPTLNKNERSIVSFQFENYENAAKLNVSPKPDTVIRVFLGIRKAKENEEIEEQILPTRKRQGYTVVEWGGCSI